LDKWEEQETRGLVPVPGARELLTALPPDRWAVVTSGSPAVARLRLTASGVPFPTVLVTAADVVSGKPAPEGYLQAASRLGVTPSDCVVVEDAPAGVAAGKAAGMRVVALLGTAAPSVLAQADYILPTLAHFRVTAAGRDSIEVAISAV
jgi:sugar-phosphatase